MTFDYIGNINTYGDNLVRLYDFDMSQAIKFRKVILETIISEKKELDLATIDFMEGRNCNLTFRISDEDEGIITSDNINFFCDLTISGYEQMVILLKPFCVKETIGHQYLYDVDSSTDLLFSPKGTW
jgi:hypothetical protein